MNDVMFGMMVLGVWEILIILLVLLLMAGLAVGVVLLAVWLARRQQNGTTKPPVVHSDLPDSPRKGAKFPFAVVCAGGVRIRWGAYFLGLIAVVIGGALLNGLLLAVGVWSGVDTVLFGLLVAVVVFHLFVIRDFHRAGRAAGPNPSGPPSATRSEHQDAPGKGVKFSFAEIRAGQVRVRWDTYLLGLVAVVFGSTLLNVLLSAAGVWIEPETVLFNILVAVVVFHLFVIRDSRKAGRSASSRPLPSDPPAPAGPPPSGVGRAAATTAVCPRCGAVLPPDLPQGLCPRCVLGVGLATQTEATGEFGSHGTKIVPPPEAEVARRFPHLEILGCLGHGGMGVVYKARQPKLNRLVALKILAPEKGADPKFAERFLREAQALARLSHPNIVTVHDFGEADGMFFLLMEYVDGMTLRQLLREARMKPEEALAIVPRICEALQFAHEQGVVHRDIKPENVLLDKQGRVKIADFGIAKLVGMEKPRAALTEERSVIGTPHYMAPEQVEKPATVDHRADIYSLGVVFYEMLTGELPLGKFQPPSKKVQVDVRLDEVVLHALEKEPERRYQHASQVKTDVENIAGTPTPSAPTLDPLVAAQWRRHLQVKYAVFFFAALCFLIATISFALQDNALAALLSGVAVVFLSQAGYRHWCAAQKLTASTTESGAIPPSSSSGRESAPSEAARPPVTGAANSNATEATIVFAGMFLFAFMLAVVLELSRASVVPFKEFWILMAIVGLIICALSLAGIWPFPSPWFPEPNFSSRNLRRHKATTGSETEQSPRFSRTAIWGAVWAPLAPLQFYVYMASPPPGPDWLQTALGLILIALGVTAVFGTTILGGIAISQIRHSRGRLYGLGLAVFDALLFPLLVLDALIIGAAVMGLKLHVASHIASGPMAVRPVWSYWWLGLAVLGIIVLADWLIIRAVWRGANKPVDGGQSSVTPTAANVAATSLDGGVWKIGSVVAVVVLLVLAVPVGSMLLAIYRPHLARQQEMNAEAVVRIEQKLAQELKGKLREADFDAASVSVNIDPAKRDRAECVISGLVKYWGLRPQEPGRQRLYSDTSGDGTFRHEGGGLWAFAGNGALQRLRFHADASAEMRAGSVHPLPMTALVASFGPEREFTLTEFNNMDGREGLDLDTGAVLAQPKDLEQWSEAELAQWIKDQGVDLFVDHGPGGQWGLLTTTAAELKLANVTNTNRARITERELEESLSSGQLPAHVPPRGILKVHPLPKESPTATTLAFKTSSGSSGLLWIAGFTDRPRGVKIGCKLLQSGTKATSAVRSPFPKAAHIGRGDKSVMLHHDDVDLHYALFYAGDFTSSSRGSHNPRTKNWNDDGGLTLKNGRTYGYLRESDSPDRLRINGGEYDLRQGRVFALHDDGAVNQLAQFPPLAVARDLEELARLVAGARAAPANGLTFGPVMERVLQSRLEGTTDWFLDFETGKILMPPLELAESLVRRQLESIPGTRAMQFTDWVERTGVDLAVYGPKAFETLGGIWMRAHGPTYEDWDDLEALTPTQTLAAIRAEEKQPTWSGRPELSGIGPKSVLSRDASVNYFFKTREGTLGVLQVFGNDGASGGLKLRYKLVRQNDPVSITHTAEVGSAAVSPSIGEAVELTVTDLADLDRGTLFNLPLPGVLPDRDPARYDWLNSDTNAFPFMRREGIDLFQGNHGLIGVDLLVVPLESKDWRGLTRAGLQSKLDALQLPKAPATSIIPEARRPFGFQTREGTLGILEITDANLPRGVKLRYKLVQATEGVVSPQPVQSRVRSLQSEPTRNLWRWRISRTPGTRLVYGVLDVTDPERPRQVLMGREDTPLATASSQNFTLRLLAETKHWQVEIDEAWAGENGGRGAVWGKIDCPPTAALRVLPAEPFGELTTNRYHVFWRGDLVSGSRTLKRLCFVARLAEPDDPIQNILDASDRVRSLGEGAPGLIRPQKEPPQPRPEVGVRFKALFIAIPLLLLGVLVVIGGIVWVVLVAKRGGRQTTAATAQPATPAPMPAPQPINPAVVATHPESAGFTVESVRSQFVILAVMW